MKVITLNEKLDKFYTPWSKVESILLPNGKYFITEDLLEVEHLTGITEDVELIKDSETEILELPSIGAECLIDNIYQYNEGEERKTVICRQTHNRTEHAIETIPALFTFFRENTDNLEWIPNELVEIDWKRVFDGDTYTVIQAHMTVVGQTPDLVPALWTKDSSGVEEWEQPTGAHDAYNTGDQVLFNGSIYESLINANVWSPAVYPAGWKLI